MSHYIKISNTDLNNFLKNTNFQTAISITSDIDTNEIPLYILETDEKIFKLYKFKQFIKKTEFYWAAEMLSKTNNEKLLLTHVTAKNNEKAEKYCKLFIQMIEENGQKIEDYSRFNTV